ncbi:acylphosphatase [Corynebacterium kutscheri]|uniref:acylphosphatase n=1 Tax=Corynebacterium kutscheri TaxID=35755 RepID=A0A0F6R037_9CORY|nr:acylphosphatase [Corynebacterium kutscheri]AKE41497.1 acylphosphatase [Corynebacterium kutscheri]VEH08775.1 acylphosphatase [Corynebacterium kutscheri]VEH09821.1 acylphosphatase [Corynebacterium kutscheri]VEH79904.1 acylphosphatase [Corynebacterium kutscheri]
MHRLTIWVHGQVQGVGFRWWCYAQAKELGISGSATNLSDGRVCIVAEGTQEQLDEILHRLRQPHYSGRPGVVETAIERWTEPKGVSGFETR